MIPTQVSDCHDVLCRNPVHRDAIEWFSIEVLKAIQDAAEETLPVSSINGNKIKNTPGFNDNVKKFKDEAFFWHSIWKSAGRPINTELHNIMKRTRNVYHREI